MHRSGFIAVLGALPFVFAACAVSAADPNVVIDAGRIDLSAPARVAEIKFAAPYENGSKHWVLYRYPKPCAAHPVTPPVSSFFPIWYDDDDPAGYGGPCLQGRQVLNQGGTIAIPAGAKAKVVFAITNWFKALPPYPPTAESIEVHLGKQSHVVPFGTSEITFDDVAIGDFPIVLIVHAGLYTGTTPDDVTIPGLLPLRVVQK